MPKPPDLDAHGRPLSGRPPDLDAGGVASTDPTSEPTPHQLNLHTPQKISEPTTYAGGFWKGLKDYGKDLISDPATMAAVGSGVALASTPVTGPWGLAAAGGLGAAAGAGGAHIAKQLRSGVPEDATDVLGSMATEGAVGGAMTAVPPLAGKAGRYLVDRAGRLAAPEAAPVVDRLAHAVLRRHGPATIAGTVGGYLGGHEGAALASGAVEAAQSPLVNRTAGRVLEGVGDIPEAMKSLMGRVTGSGRTAALDEAAAARQAQFRAGMTPAEPMTPWSPFEAGAESAESAPPSFRSQAGRSIPTTAELDAEYPVGSGATYDPLMAGRRRMAEERWGIRPESPPPFDILREKMGRVRRGNPPSMASLEAGAPLDALSETLAPAEPVFGKDAFDARFRQQLMDSLARAR